MNPNSIYAIQQRYIDLAEEFEDNGGELTEELEELLIKNAEEFKAKAQSYIGIIKTKEGNLNQIDDEIKRLTALKRSTNRVIEQLESTLLKALKLYGQQDAKGIWRYDGVVFKLSTRKSDKCLIIAEEELASAIKDRIYSITEIGELSELNEEVEDGKLNLSYNPNSVTEPSFEGQPIVNHPLTFPETDFINNHLIYDAKFAIRFIDFVDVVRTLQSRGYRKEDLNVDIKIPKKAASEFVKNSTGFRIAKIDTNYSLTIK